MALKLVTPDQPLLIKSIIFYLYCDPGIGKTSLSHTADKPICYDFDKGAHRAGALRRGTVVQVENWLDVADQTVQDLEPYNTIVCDTNGAMLDCIKAHLQKNPQNRQYDGTLTIKAQGLATKTFSDVVNFWLSLGKDVVFIAHAIEEEVGKDKIKVMRPDIAGRNRHWLYRIADVMGYMSNTTNKEGNILRFIRFNPGTNHHAKNSGQLGDANGDVWIPDLMQNPTFLADLIKQAKDHINTMTPAQISEAKAVDDLRVFTQNCEEVTYTSELNQLTESLRLDKEHRYYKQMRQVLYKKARAMNCGYDEEKRRWLEPPEFIGITNEQRDELQDLLTKQKMDVKAFCEANNLETLLQIHASKFDDCKAFILNGCRQQEQYQENDNA